MTAALRLAFCLAVVASSALIRLTLAFDLTDRSDCRDIFRLNFWFILDMKHAPENLGGPWKLVETMFNKMTDPAEYFPNLREYTFSVSYGTPGTKVPDFYTISPCNTTQCLRQAIRSHIAHKSSTKTSNVYSSMEEMFLRGPVNGQQGRGLREFVKVGTKTLLILFSTGSRLRDRGVNNWEAMRSFLPIRGLVSIRIDNDPDSRALIAKHEIMKDFYHFHVDANFKPNDDAGEVTRALKTFRNEPKKGADEMCSEVNYCQYSGRVGPCIRLKNGSCFKYADIVLKGGVLCLKKGYNLCQDFEPCDYATTTTTLVHAIMKKKEESITIVAAKLAAPASTTVAPAMTAGILGISASIIIIVLIIVILLFVILRKKRRSQIKPAPKLDKSSKKTAAGATKSGKTDGGGGQRTAAVQASMMLAESERSKSTARTGGTPGSMTPPVKKTLVVKKTSKTKTKAAPVASSKGKTGIRA